MRVKVSRKSDPDTAERTKLGDLQSHLVLGTGDGEQMARVLVLLLVVMVVSVLDVR